MAHEELKALYEIDKQHSDTPWEFWESYELGKWVDRKTHPLWLEEGGYRRKASSPVWPDYAEDARKWKEAVFQSLITIDDREFRRNFLNILNPKQPQLIQCYTADQWQVIIDGKFLCEFSDDSDFPIMSICNLNFVGDDAFHDVDECQWKYCRPLRIKGVRQPWFGGECPVNSYALVVVTLADGDNRCAKASGFNWHVPDNKSRRIVEFIEL